MILALYSEQYYKYTVTYSFHNTVTSWVNIVMPVLSYFTKDKFTTYDWNGYDTGFTHWISVFIKYITTDQYL